MVHEWTEEGKGEYIRTSDIEYYNDNSGVDANNIHAIG